MPIAEFTDIHRAYERGRNVLDRVSFAIEPGQVIGLVSKNGAGCRLLPTKDSLDSTRLTRLTRLVVECLSVVRYPMHEMTTLTTTHSCRAHSCRTLARGEGRPQTPDRLAIAIPPAPTQRRQKFGHLVQSSFSAPPLLSAVRTFTCQSTPSFRNFRP